MNLRTFSFFILPGVITTGSAQRYLESYIVSFSKDRKNWKLHRDVLSKEKKVCALTAVAPACYALLSLVAMVPQVFRAHTDGHLRVLNSVFPPAVARFVRLQPLSWHGRASARVQVLGCPVSKVTPRMRSSDRASLCPPPHPPRLLSETAGPTP